MRKRTHSQPHNKAVFQHYAVVRGQTKGHTENAKGHAHGQTENVMLKPIFAIFQDEKGAQSGAQKGNIRKKYKKGLLPL